MTKNFFYIVIVCALLAGCSQTTARQALEKKFPSAEIQQIPDDKGFLIRQLNGEVIYSSYDGGNGDEPRDLHLVRMFGPTKDIVVTLERPSPSPAPSAGYPK